MDCSSRDEMLSRSVMSLYELGKFEKELAIYGCAYQEENGEIIYVMGTDLEKLFDWKYDVNNLRKCPTAVHRTSIHTLIPTGMEDLIAEELQKSMMAELYSRYTKEYFANNEKINNKIATNDAYQLLKKVKFRLDGIGTLEQLELYQGLVDKAYLNKVLKEKSYYDFCEWVNAEKNDISDDLHKTDIYEKEFYGFIYIIDRDKYEIIVDGCKSHIYMQMEEKALEGALISPIICKKYWYNNNYRLNDAKKDSEIFFKWLFNEKYRKVILLLDEIIKTRQKL